jgi:thioredoxin reductase
MFMKKACLADSAARVKQKLDIPVMAVGRINDPMVANDIIREDKADLVCIGRGLLADPEMPNKALRGELDDIRICIACNTCMESIFRRGRVECLVNPTLGREKEMEIIPADIPKRVMVIGGGPGGLNVAWVAAKRGHEVNLYEKQSSLGGQLIFGSITGYKKELLSLIQFQKRQVEKSGVTCHLDYEVTLDTVKTANPDVVVLATGSVPIQPPIEGINGPTVASIYRIFKGDRPVVKRSVVIGGGATGCEVALYLAENDCPVTLVEALPKIGVQIESITKKLILKKLKEYDVNILVESQVARIDEKGVLVRNNEGGEKFIEAERVVSAVGNRSYNSLYDQIKSLGIPIFQIGDCLEPRSAKAAIYEAAVIGRAI